MVRVDLLDGNKMDTKLLVLLNRIVNHEIKHFSIPWMGANREVSQDLAERTWPHTTGRLREIVRFVTFFTVGGGGWGSSATSPGEMERRNRRRFVLMVFVFFFSMVIRCIEYTMGLKVQYVSWAVSGLWLPICVSSIAFPGRKRKYKMFWEFFIACLIDWYYLPFVYDAGWTGLYIFLEIIHS